MSLSYNNNNEVYGSAMMLDTSDHTNSNSNTRKNNAYSSKPSFSKLFFEDIIKDTYQRQQIARKKQRHRTIIMYLVLCCTVFLGSQNHIKSMNDVINVFTICFISIIVFKLLFYYPNQMLEIRYKLQGRLDAYSHLCNSPNSPLNLIDEAIEIENDYESLVAKYNELCEEISYLENENNNLRSKIQDPSTDVNIID